MLLSIAAASMSLLPLGSATEQDTNLFTHVNAIAYAENNSVYHLAKGHATSYNRGESAFTFNEFAIGTRYKNFSLSYIYRYDWFLSYNEDTMAFYGTIANDTLAKANKTYDINLKVNHINTEGLRMAYTFPYKHSQFYFAGSYLKARELMDGNLSGDVTLSGNCATNSSCYSGDLALDYYYSEDVLLDRVATQPSSIYGYSFDIGADWLITPQWLASFYIQDLFNEILWENAPYTTADVTTNTTAIVDNKYEVKLATGSGYEGNSDYKQTLPVKYNMLLGYTYDQKHSGYLQGFYAYDTLLINLGYQYKLNDTAYRLKLYPLQQALGIEFSHSLFKVGITSDSLNYQKSELLALQLGLTIPLE